MFFHLVKSVGQKKKILNPHEESIFRPSDFMLRCWILYHPFYSIITKWPYWHYWFKQCEEHVWTLWWASLIIESLWLRRRASGHGIWRSEVWLLMGTQTFYFVPHLWQDEKHFSIIRIVCQTVRRITNKPWKCFLVLGYKGLCVHTDTKRRSPFKCRAKSHFTINY